jgi:hypothetical protein
MLHRAVGYFKLINIGLLSKNVWISLFPHLQIVPVLSVQSELIVSILLNLRKGKMSFFFFFFFPFLIIIIVIFLLTVMNSINLVFGMKELQIKFPQFSASEVI